MVRKENITSKLEIIKKYLNRLDEFRDADFEEVISDHIKIAACERYLYLTLQSAIDLAEMLVKLKKLGKPETMSESFEELLKDGYINLDLSESLVKMVGFRNALSHAYEKINYNIFREVLKTHIKDVEKFCTIVSEKEDL